MALIAEFVAGRRPTDLYQEYLGPVFETWAEILIGAAPPSGRVLDMACGTGIVSRALARQNSVETVNAFDISAEMVDAAQQHSEAGATISYSTASAEKTPFADNAFSAAYCQQGFQFFPDKVGALKEAGRVVAPGGVIAISVWTFAKDGNPLFEALENIVARELGEDLVPFGPFSFGDAAALEQCAVDAGQRVVSTTRKEALCRLPDPRSFVLFDLMFLGRPGPDGQLHPLFDPADSSKDPLIEKLIDALEKAAAPYRQPDGSMLAPFTSNILVAESGR